MKKDKENTWHYEIALRQNAEFLPPENTEDKPVNEKSERAEKEDA